jgi:hypothetical protein
MLLRLPLGCGRNRFGNAPLRAADLRNFCEVLIPSHRVLLLDGTSNRSERRALIGQSFARHSRRHVRPLT